MDKFEDVIATNPPCLVVSLKYQDGVEVFDWGMGGASQIPRLTALGAICRVQSEIHFKAAKECPVSALVIVYDLNTKKTDWFMNPSIPIDPLVGMLETIKYAIMNVERPKSQLPMIFGPDGNPVRGRRIR